MTDFVRPPRVQDVSDQPGFLDRWAKKLLLSIANQIRLGELTIVDSEEQHVFGKPSDQYPLRASLLVHDFRFYRDVVFGGSVGAAESYMKGFWDSDDLTGVIRILVLNIDTLDCIDTGWSRITEPLKKGFHVLRRNSLAGSRKNIHAHYDLGNDFYALFLDETMAYSNAIFEEDTYTLYEASIAKFEQICKKLFLSPENHIIEIGGGWGGFAIHAVKNYGCQVTTTTISEEQYTFARARINELGLSDKIEVIKKDYRELTGKYDRLVSIEMIEAIGHQYFDRFFQCCNDLLQPNGMMALQAITIPDHIFDRHKHSVDFIKRYIFPGSCIPSLAAIMGSIAKKTDLRLIHLEDITFHYPRTLKTWRDQFLANTKKVRQMGFSESFIRMWEFYLCYCEGSFRERYNGDYQMIFAKPFCRNTIKMVK